MQVLTIFYRLMATNIVMWVLPFDFNKITNRRKQTAEWRFLRMAVEGKMLDRKSNENITE
jgi:hypothetical protein